MPSNLFGILFGAALAYTAGHALFVNFRGRRGMARAEGIVPGQLVKAPAIGN